MSSKARMHYCTRSVSSHHPEVTHHTTLNILGRRSTILSPWSFRCCTDWQRNFSLALINKMNFLSYHKSCESFVASLARELHQKRKATGNGNDMFVKPKNYKPFFFFPFYRLLSFSFSAEQRKHTS